MRRALALWAAIVVPIWATLAACLAWEPMVYDGWALRIIQRAAPTTMWWNLGDDLADPDRREALARRLGLAAIVLR